MKISAKRLAQLKQGARRGGKAVAGGVKGSALQVLSGAVTCFGNQKLAESSEFYRSKWFIGPAVIALVGYMLKKKGKTAPVGHAMLGAAGYSLAQNYALAKNNAAASADAGQVYAIRGQVDTGMIYTPGAPMLSPGAATAPTSATSSYQTADISEAAGL
jgi:hypothetical protein